MAAPRTARAHRAVLAVLTTLLILVDGALAAIGALVRNAHRNGNLTTAEAATFTLVGVSALAGAVVLLLAVIALGTRSPGPARLASALAWLRLAGVVIALTALAAGYGQAALVGLFETTGAVVALADAVVALIATAVAARRTRDG